MKSDEIAYELATELYEVARTSGLADSGHEAVGRTLSGGTELRIDKYIADRVPDVSERIARRHSARLKVYAESSQVEVGRGETFFVSLDECDGSRNRNPSMRAVLVGVSRDESTKNLVSGAVAKFDGSEFYAKDGKSFIKTPNSKERLLESRDPPRRYIIFVHAPGGVHEELYSGLIKDFLSSSDPALADFDRRTYGAIGAELMDVASGYADALIDIRLQRFRKLGKELFRVAHPYDIAGPSIVCHYAGYEVTDGEGSELAYPITDVNAPVSIIVAHKKLHPEIMHYVRRHI